MTRRDRPAPEKWTLTGEDKPKICWQTYALAVAWAVVFAAIAWARSAFISAVARMIHGAAFVALPALTRLVLLIPGGAWVLLGMLGAGAIVAKSALMPPKRARLVDRIALGLLILIAMTAVLALAVPLVTLRHSLRQGP